MASAKRLMLMRHSWRMRSRMGAPGRSMGFALDIGSAPQLQGRPGGAGPRFPGHVGVGVPDRGQIAGPWPGVEVGQEAVVARAALLAGHSALGVVHVAEHYGPRRADRLAGGA